MWAAHVVTGMKHEVIDNEPAAAVKKVSQTLTPVRSIKTVVFADGLPRKLATLLVELIAKAGEFLFLGEERGSRREPVVMRYDWMVLYVAAAVVGHAFSSPRHEFRRLRARPQFRPSPDNLPAIPARAPNPWRGQ